MQYLLTAARVLAATAFSLALASCGGHCDDGAAVALPPLAPPAASAPAAPATPSAATTPAGLALAWAGVAASPDAGPVTYRVLVDPDGAGPLAAVSVNAVLLAPAYTVTDNLLLASFGAQYSVQTCNAAGCSAPSVPATAGGPLMPGMAQPAGTTQGNGLGTSVRLSADGSTMVVAAERESSGATGINGDQNDVSAALAGAVYVFTKSGGVWSQQAYLKASNTAPLKQFGSSISLADDGNTLAVGAVGGQEAFIFTRSAGIWSQQARVQASNSDPNDRFGDTVALSPDGMTLAVGATSEESAATGINGNQADNSLLGGSGAVYVFARAGNAWNQQAYVKADRAGLHRFGTSLALSPDGNTMAVGARYDDAGDLVDPAEPSGGVYVFSRTGNVWSQQARLKAGSRNANMEFGDSVAISADGNTLAVGAPYQDGGGAAYLFVRGPGGWSQQAVLRGSNSEDLDLFGFSVALSRDAGVVVVGAYGEASNATGLNGNQADNSVPFAGAAYVFARAGSEWNQVAYVKPASSGEQLFGSSVALASDGNSFAVGAQGNPLNAGAVFTYSR